MKGFILAAGLGERLRPLTNRCAKALVPVLNLPSICYSLFLLKEAGIQEVVCNLHHEGSGIVRFLEKHGFFGLDISFSEEDEILGTGGGLKKCEALLGDDDFVLINSDVVLDADIGFFADRHRELGMPGTLLLYRTERAGDIGPVGVEENRVVGFHTVRGARIDSDLIYTGVAVLSPAIFQYLKMEFSSIVTTGFAGLMGDGALGYVEHAGFWLDVGTIRSYWEANVRAMKEVLGLGKRLTHAMGLSHALLSPSCRIGKDSVIKDTVVGEGAKIGEDVFLEKTVVLPGSSVANRSIIKNSVVFEDRLIQIE